MEACERLMDKEGKMASYKKLGKMAENELLFQLRRRERWNDELLKKRGIPMGILISFLCMCAFIFLCTQSHEAVSRLPKEMYFPCLGLAYISAVCLAIFSIKRKRGE